MKTLRIFSLAILAMVFAAACEKDLSLAPGDQIVKQMAAGDRTEGVLVLFPDWQSGNADVECARANGEENCGDFAYKIDPPEAGTYPYAGNNISISYDEEGGLSWSSNYPVCAVIVKGGPGANVYYYNGAYSDDGLYPPINPNNGKPYGFSHITFCFSDPDKCYQEETAWATGPRYSPRGNWATYTPYPGDGQSVDIYAGRTILAGTAMFTDNGDNTVNIAINLTGGFIFYYDLFNPVADDNIKIQDYAFAPSGNPAPGLFAWKAYAEVGDTDYTITVPKNNFYGIHLDVARPVPCE